MRRPISAPRPAGGFTVVELLIVITVVGLMMTLVLPAIGQFIHRGKIEGIAREVGVLMQTARYEAIKLNRPAVIRVDTSTSRVAAFVDENGNFQLDDGEVELAWKALPTGVTFAAPPTQDAIDGFDTAGNAGWAVFNPDGSAAVSGAFRFGDQRGNYLETRIMLQSTGRVAIRKWDGAAWHAPGEGGKPWQWS